MNITEVNHHTYSWNVFIMYYLTIQSIVMMQVYEYIMIIKYHSCQLITIALITQKFITAIVCVYVNLLYRMHGIIVEIFLHQRKDRHEVKRHITTLHYSQRCTNCFTESQAKGNRAAERTQKFCCKITQLDSSNSWNAEQKKQKPDIKQTFRNLHLEEIMRNIPLRQGKISIEFWPNLFLSHLAKLRTHWSVTVICCQFSDWQLLISCIFGSNWTLYFGWKFLIIIITNITAENN